MELGLEILLLTLSNTPPPPLPIPLRKQQRKNKVSEWIKVFEKRKGDIPPVACGDAKWRGVDLTLVMDNWEMVWGAMFLG